MHKEKEKINFLAINILIVIACVSLWHAKWKSLKYNWYPWCTLNKALFSSSETNAQDELLWSQSVHHPSIYHPITPLNSIFSITTELIYTKAFCLRGTENLLKWSQYDTIMVKTHKNLLNNQESFEAKFWYIASYCSLDIFQKFVFYLVLCTKEVNLQFLVVI